MVINGHLWPNFPSRTSADFFWFWAADENSTIWGYYCWWVCSFSATNFNGFKWSAMVSHDQTFLEKIVLIFVDQGQFTRLEIVLNAISVNLWGNWNTSSSFWKTKFEVISQKEDQSNQLAGFFDHQYLWIIGLFAEK